MKNLSLLTISILALFLVSCQESSELSPVGTWQLEEVISENTLVLEEGISVITTTELQESDATMTIREDGTVSYAGDCSVLFTTEATNNGQLITTSLEQSVDHTDSDTWREIGPGQITCDDQAFVRANYTENEMVIVVNSAEADIDSLDEIEIEFVYSRK